MIEDFVRLVDPGLMHRSGSVFYSGRSAFAAPAPLYILGLNPGGCPLKQQNETIALDIEDVLERIPDDWSAYRDEAWEGKPPGTHGMQPRVLHMFRLLGLSPHLIPASNLIFVRSSSEAALKAEKAQLMDMCWPVHEAVMAQLGTRVVVCFGGTAGRWVREATGANTLTASYSENNARKWTSTVHAASSGVQVATVTHPSRVDWTNPLADPTQLIREALSRAEAS